VWSIGLTINATTGEATASTRTDHTDDLGGTGVLGGISSFGLDSAGELYIVSHTNGTIIQMIGDAPSPPTNLRIIR
jgi:hypothetical protein